MSSMVLYMTVILRTQCKLMTYVNSLITLKCLHSIKLECYLRSALHLMRNMQLVSYMNVTHDARATKGVRE